MRSLALLLLDTTVVSVTEVWCAARRRSTRPALDGVSATTWPRAGARPPVAQHELREAVCAAAAAATDATVVRAVARRAHALWWGHRDGLGLVAEHARALSVPSAAWLLRRDADALHRLARNPALSPRVAAWVLARALHPFRPAPMTWVAQTMRPILEAWAAPAGDAVSNAGRALEALAAGPHGALVAAHLDALLRLGEDNLSCRGSWVAAVVATSPYATPAQLRTVARRGRSWAAWTWVVRHPACPPGVVRAILRRADGVGALPLAADLMDYEAGAPSPLWLRPCAAPWLLRRLHEAARVWDWRDGWSVDSHDQARALCAAAAAALRLPLAPVVFALVVRALLPAATTDRTLRLAALAGAVGGTDAQLRAVAFTLEETRDLLVDPDADGRLLGLRLLGLLDLAELPAVVAKADTDAPS